MNHPNHSIPMRGLAAAQKGITLIEVLVTMVVIALGLLGHAKLLTTTVSQNNSAYMRSLATMFAYDVTESMRANRPAAISGSYNIAIGSNASGGTVAGDDLAAWKTRLRNALPAGDASVTVGMGGITTIVIQWDDNRTGTPISLTTQTNI